MTKAATLAKLVQQGGPLSSGTLDPDLAAIADLLGTAGLLRKTGDGVWTLDTTDIPSTATKKAIAMSVVFGG